MGEAVELAIVLAAKDAASEVLGHVGGKLDSLGKSGELAKAAFIGLTAGLGAAITAGIDFARAAADEEQGVERMRQAITATGKNWRDYSDDIEETIYRMERMTAFSDGEMRDAMTTLTNETGDAEEALKRLPIATDFARGAQIDLATASKLLGKVTDETVNVLGRYGIHVDKGTKATEVLALVQQKFAGQSEAFASTAAGKWQIFQNQLDNVKEDIGGALLPIFTGALDMAVSMIDAFRGPFGALAPIIETVSQLLYGITGALGEMFGVITGTAPGAGAILSNMVGEQPAKVIMTNLAFVRDLFKAIFAGDIPAIISTFRDRGTEVIKGVLGLIQTAGPQIRDGLLTWAREFVAWVGPASLKMVQELLNMLSTGLHWIADHSDEIGDALVDWGGKFGSFIIDVAIPAFIEYAPQILGTIIHWALFDALPALVTTFFNIGRKIIGAIADAFGSAVHDIWEAISYMFRQAFAMIDFWVGPFHVTGHGISVQMPELHFPGFAEGGEVAKTGLALVHAGETIIPAAASGASSDNSGGGAGHGHDIYLDGKLVARLLGRHTYKEYRMMGGRV